MLDVEDGRNSSGNDRGDDWSLCCCCVIAAAREETAAADDDDDEAAALLDWWRCFLAMAGSCYGLVWLVALRWPWPWYEVSVTQLQ